MLFVLCLRCSELKLLFVVYSQVYVKINKEAKTNESVSDAGRVYFSRMEQGAQSLYFT